MFLRSPRVCLLLPPRGNMTWKSVYMQKKKKKKKNYMKSRELDGTPALWLPRKSFTHYQLTCLRVCPGHQTLK